LKSLIISIVSLGVLVMGWCFFVNYADDHLHKLMDEIEDEITISVKNSEWDKASNDFKDLSKSWHKDKKIYSFFIDTSAINETDYSIARAKAYISAENEPLAIGELSCIKEQLGFLHLNELITIDNVL